MCHYQQPNPNEITLLNRNPATICPHYRSLSYLKKPCWPTSLWYLPLFSLAILWKQQLPPGGLWKTQQNSRCGWRRGGISSCVDENDTKSKRCPRGKRYNCAHEGRGDYKIQSVCRWRQSQWWGPAWDVWKWAMGHHRCFLMSYSTCMTDNSALQF